MTLHAKGEINISKEVNNEQILQAIIELSGQLQQTEKRLTEQFNTLDAKVSVLSESLLTTQAEVKILKGAQ